MAIFFMRCGIVGKTSKGFTKMKDVSEYRTEEEKKKKEIEKKLIVKDKENERVLHSEIVAPFLTPSKFKNRSLLWQEVEKKEIRKDAQLAREIIIALPKELKIETQAKIVKEFCKKNLVSKGMICDFSIHNQKKENGNYHVHILCTLRKIQKKEFGNKERSWNDRRLVKQWQNSWQEIANIELKKKNVEEIKHKTKDEKNRPYLGIKKYHLFKKVGYEMMRNYNFEIKEKEENAVITYKTNETRIKNAKTRTDFFENSRRFIANDYQIWLEEKRKALLKKIKEKLAKKKLAEQNKIKQEAKTIILDNFKQNQITIEKLPQGIQINYLNTTKNEKTQKYLQKNLLQVMNEVAKENPEIEPKNDEIQRQIKILTQKQGLTR